MSKINAKTAMEDILIRLEEPKDYHTVEDVTRAAFAYPERIERSKIGCPLEHYMVHVLREKDGIKDLSFVAEIDGKIVGYIIYSKACVIQLNGDEAELFYGKIRT